MPQVCAPTKQPNGDDEREVSEASIHRRSGMPRDQLQGAHRPFAVAAFVSCISLFYGLPTQILPHYSSRRQLLSPGTLEDQRCPSPFSIGRL